VPDNLWRAATFGAGKPFADDQAGDMVEEKEGLANFDAWVGDFVKHVETKGRISSAVDERAAASTTNTDKPQREE
jgi:hypothetical protein